MQIKNINEKEFNLFQAFIFQQAGISMADHKRALVAGRLSKRLSHFGLNSFEQYYKFILSPENRAEKQVAINLLTTNETHFFREPKHFDYLRDVIISNHPRGRSFRVWSGASSTGEEVYTLAMMLAEHMPANAWELMGSDISTAVLDKARTGSYPLSRADEIPQQYLRKYCLKGTGNAQGTMLIDKSLRMLVSFMPINLIEPYPEIGEFDVIFLRNVMIYFNLETKQQIINKMIEKLKPGAYFFISHSESLNGIKHPLKLVSASVYRNS